VNEPANNTAWVDRFGDVWVRLDDVTPYFDCNWWPLTDGPGWEEWARTGVGSPRTWATVQDYMPFTEADPTRTAQALDRVRQEAHR